ncbi:MAG: cation transporter, partial [Pseudomonadota bacterium]|nr:cation transporter [Pseudomonadota bacterium]
MHDHHHDHSHHFDTHNRSFALAVVLNTLFVVSEVVYGVLSGSLALVADAGHNLSDVMGLVMAWLASWLASKAATYSRTYGLKKTTILAAL